MNFSNIMRNQILHLLTSKKKFSSMVMEKGMLKLKYGVKAFHHPKKSQVPMYYFTKFHKKMVGSGLKYTHQSRLGSIWTILVPRKKKKNRRTSLFLKS
jgi:hypothetical protein